MLKLPETSIPKMLTVYDIIKDIDITDRELFQRLFNVFIDPKDVDEFIEAVTQDEYKELLDLTGRQVALFFSKLRRYRVELAEHMEEMQDRISGITDKFNANIESWSSPSLTYEDIEVLTRRRKRLGKMLEIIDAPRGVKQKTLREVVCQNNKGKKIDDERVEPLLLLLKQRFTENMERHEGVLWEDVEKRLRANPEGMQTLMWMQDTDGEPDLVGFDQKTGACKFFDCCKEIPRVRANVVFDAEAQARLYEDTGIRVKGNALDLAESWGAEVLTRSDHMQTLQSVGDFDHKTWCLVVNDDENIVPPKTYGNKTKLAMYCSNAAAAEPWGGWEGTDYFEDGLGFRCKVLI